MEIPDINLECDVPVEINEFKDCPGKKLCSKCAWYARNNGYCPGCDDDYRRRCIKGICAFTSCGTCGGGKKVNVPGICGRAPASWRKKWDQLLKSPIPEYEPEPLEINCRLIPVIYPQVRQYNIPQQFPQIDAWAVPIHKVANRQGIFYDNDLKRYLGLPPNKKLILSTCATDDYEEMLWKKGPNINYKNYNIDYWFPAHFSIYDDDSKIFQFANAKRQQLHAVWTKSQFIWFRLGKHIPIEFLSPILNALSVLISTNQMYYNHNKRIFEKEVKAADKWFPKEKAFFVVGDHRRLPITSGRTCYQLNTTWLIRGVMGVPIVGERDMKTPIKKVLKNNLKEVLRYV